MWCVILVFLGAMDSLNFRLLGIAGYGPAFKLALSENRAYVSAGATVMCFDISSPDTALLLGYLHTPADVWGLYVRGDTLLVAGGAGGLWVVDFTEPSAPRVLSRLPTGGHANGVWLEGQRAFVTQHQALGVPGLLVVDVSDPSAPEVLGSYSTGNLFQAGAGCRVRGDTAFVAFCAVAGSVGSLKILDVSDPSNIREISSVDSPVSPQDLALNGDTLYLADYTNGLLVVDISRPDSPRIIGGFKRQNASGLSYAMDVECRGDTVYVVDGFVWPWAVPNANFLVLDASDPQNISVVCGCNTVDFAWGLDLGEGIAAVADEWGGLILVDLSSPDTAFVRSRWRTGSYAQEVVYWDGYAYVAAEGGGVRVHSLSDSIMEVGQAPCYSFVHDIVYDSGFCYIAAQWGGVGVVDVSDPTNPYQVSYFTPDTGNLFLTCMGLDKAGQYCYAAWGDSGLGVVDVSDPYHPYEVARVFPWGGAGVRYVLCRDTLAYLTTDSGLVVMDISDPPNPRELGHLRIQDPEKLWVDGDRVYVAAGYRGLLVVDASDPGGPESLGVYTVGPFEFVKDVWASGPVAYISYGKKFGYNMLTTTHGVAALDVSDPENIVELGYYFFPPVAYGIFAKGDTVFCARETGDIYVLEFTGSAGLGERPPDPGLRVWLSDGQLVASLPGGGRWSSAEVYDCSGRLRLRVGPGSGLLRIELHSLEPGVYTLVIRRGKGAPLVWCFPLPR